MNQFTEKKKKLEEAIVETMITALEQEKITEEEMSMISNDVLDEIDLAGTENDLQLFLEKLAKKWGLFDSLVILNKAELQEKVEDEVAQGVLVLLEHGKIENAIKLAQSVTHKQDQNQPN